MDCLNDSGFNERNLLILSTLSSCIDAFQKLISGPGCSKLG